MSDSITHITVVAIDSPEDLEAYFAAIEADAADEDADRWSELSKSLYGTRRLPHLAQGAYEAFCDAHPGEIPTVHDGQLLTDAEWEEESRPRPIEGVTLNGQALVFDPVAVEVRVA